MTFNQQTFQTITKQCQSQDATLVAVSKYRDIDTIKQALDAGVTDLGESRVEIASKKKKELSDYSFRLHMIGHLQSRKVRDAVQVFDIIQSVDSEKLLKKIDRACAEINKMIPILLQLNMTGEEQKYGFKEEHLADMIELAQTLEHVDLQGLMCMGALDDAEATRNIYRKLKIYCDKYDLKECSIGMSGDYSIALQEGATMVRIGSLLLS